MTNNKLKMFKSVFLVLPVAYFLLFGYTTLALAQNTPTQPTDYTLLAPIPIENECIGNETSANPCKTSVGPYVSGIFKLTIGIATALAVIMIMFGGIKYMSSDAIGGKSEAKSTIQNAIWGLLLAMSAWLILYTINPKIVSFNLEISPGVSAGNTALDGRVGSAVGSLQLTQQQAITTLDSAGITTAGPINLNGIRQVIVDEVISLKSNCANCAVVITSATGGSHAEGACSHGNGYKVDIRRNNEGVALTNYITQNYEKLQNRSDGAPLYKSPTGGLYALESTHWDVVKC